MGMKGPNKVGCGEKGEEGEEGRRSSIKFGGGDGVSSFPCIAPFHCLTRSGVKWLERELSGTGCGGALLPPLLASSHSTHQLASPTDDRGLHRHCGRCICGRGWAAAARGRQGRVRRGGLMLHAACVLREGRETV